MLSRYVLEVASHLNLRTIHFPDSSVTYLLQMLVQFVLPNSENHRLLNEINYKLFEKFESINVILTFS